MKFDRHSAAVFNESYDPTWEDEAHGQRGVFLERFPLESLATLTLSQYVIGLRQREGFSYWVEQGTRKWAIVNGATSSKFGIYFGKTKTDSEKRYRYTQKFSKGLPPEGAERRVFTRIKGALLALVQAGQQLDFERIDGNQLSQMFKAKILSLYFPQNFLNVCSGDDLENLATAARVSIDSPSKIQHELLRVKSRLPEARQWSNLKYMAYLYRSVLERYNVPSERKNHQSVLRKPAKVDFEKLMSRWRELGKVSEAYALEFERRRLRSLGLKYLTTKIQDRTQHPGFGYDFESYSSAKKRRFIEVKTFTAISADDARFFLSENERKVSTAPPNKDEYYFYLVIYGADGNPEDVRIEKAGIVYANAKIEPQTYLVVLPRQRM